MLISNVVRHSSEYTCICDFSELCLSVEQLLGNVVTAKQRNENTKLNVIFITKCLDYYEYLLYFKRDRRVFSVDSELLRHQHQNKLSASIAR